MITIAESELEFSFVRSSGPGGQNVNKVNSKAVLRWNVATSRCIADTVRARLLERLAARLTRDGALIVTSDRYRDQGRNREDCIAKLHEMVAAAARVPKQRRETKPSYSSRLRVKAAKSLQAQKKSNRRRPHRDE